MVRYLGTEWVGAGLKPNAHNTLKALLIHSSPGPSTVVHNLFTIHLCLTVGPLWKE